VIGSTPAILGMHEVSSFKGLSSPALFRTPLGERDIDQPPLAALMARWRRRSEAAEPSGGRGTDALAQHGVSRLALPGRDGHDVLRRGADLSIWASAFKILVHPGGSGQANRDKVFGMIEGTQWAFPLSGELAHNTAGKTKLVKCSLTCWLYQVFYECRNDFLHGNPVDSGNLFLAKQKRTIFEYAAPLYRIALTAFLPLGHDAPMPSANDPIAFGSYIVKHMEFIKPQENAEEALLTATQGPGERGARRARAARPVS